MKTKRHFRLKCKKQLGENSILKNLILFKFFVLVAAVMFVAQCSGSVYKTEIKSFANGGGEIPSLPDEAKIEIIDPDYEVKEKNVEALESFPIPQVKLVFDSKNISSAELPEDVKIILNAHWKQALQYFYDQEFNKPKSAQESSERMKIWSNYCIKTDRKLKESPIAAPNGQRKISQKESMAIWGGLNRSAINVIAKLKSL
ncbi:MAG TPA: hypothetical protein VNB22_21305 [Pyrinomonadaceae bacterium]|nr:hypothetical protein [Pyrinomonadaceae bacterium]